jgi:hypothetical protein
MSKPYKPAAANPCAACPWRIGNQGKSHPTDHSLDYFYEPATRASMWSGTPFTKPDGSTYRFRRGLTVTALRDGHGMVCHPTAGSPEPRECAGNVVLQHREVMRARKMGVPRYLATVAHGLTRKGLTRVSEAVLGRRVSLGDVAAADESELRNGCHPAIGDRGIGHDHGAIK